MNEIEKPTKELVDKYVKKFERGSNGVDERSVSIVFSASENHCDEACLLARVVILNDRYSTQIRNYEILSVVNKLRDLYKKENLAQLIRLGDPISVEILRNIPVDYTTNNGTHLQYDKDLYSFATKYCSFAARIDSGYDYFPIFDSYVAGMLAGLRDEFHFAKFTNKSLREDYSNLKSVIDSMKDYFKLDDEYSKLDHYLWLYGNEHNIRKQC